MFFYFQWFRAFLMQLDLLHREQVPIKMQRQQLHMQMDLHRTNRLTLQLTSMHFAHDQHVDKILSIASAIIGDILYFSAGTLKHMLRKFSA